MHGLMASPSNTLGGGHEGVRVLRHAKNAVLRGVPKAVL